MLLLSSHLWHSDIVGLFSFVAIVQITVFCWWIILKTINLFYIFTVTNFFFLFRWKGKYCQHYSILARSKIYLSIYLFIYSAFEYHSIIDCWKLEGTIQMLTDLYSNDSISVTKGIFSKSMCLKPIQSKLSTGERWKNILKSFISELFLIPG